MKAAVVVLVLVASMGPRLFRRGDQACAGALRGRAARLQWGHAFSGVETRYRPMRATPGIGCFNGATPFQAWRRERQRQRQRQKAGLQWGHAFSGVETTGGDVRCRRLARRFNGATPFQAWRHSSGVLATICWWVCFNGATPFQAWRPTGGRRRPAPPVPASMGPRLFRRGDFAVEAPDLAARRASMGPRLFRRGDLPYVRDESGAVSTASMGPRLFRRGDACPSGPHTRRPLASMGPRLFRRGDIAALRAPADISDQLQWGHAFSGVETNTLASMSPTVSRGFNGATPFQAWRPRV